MEDFDEAPPSLQERKRQAARVQIAAIGVELLARDGFDAVTADQIARAAGISRRSFFRYFDTKEDVVLHGVAEAGRLVEAALRTRPADEPAWEALCHALNVLQDQPAYPAESLLTISRMLISTPSLRARELEKHEHWEALLVPHLLARLPPSPDGPNADYARATALVGAALACLRAATAAWVRADGQIDLQHVFLMAADTVRG